MLDSRQQTKKEVRVNWTIFLVVVLLNTALCLLQYGAERIDRKRGKIAKRHSIVPGANNKFLYWEDYYTQTYGDLLCLVWVMNGFAHLLITGRISATQWLIFFIVKIIAITIFLYLNLKPGHKVDWGWPTEGKISLGGFSHLPYFGGLSAMSVICLINIISGELNGLLLYSTLIGGLSYIVTIMADIKSGHFKNKK